MKIPMPRGDRLTAVIATGVVAVLGVAAVVVGVGVSSASPKLADVGAWLWSSARGAVVHANGLSGRVDGRIENVAKPGSHLKVDFVLKAKNPAGEGQSTASATADLTYPRQAYQNANNDQTDTIIRPGTGKTGEVGRIPKGQYRSITVICQLRGDSVTESESGETSVVWDRIEWNGGVGYLSDTLMKTPRGGFPAAPLFQCDD
ncbi:hypothetical protein AB0O34_25695 [Sphaerisporangium sp. NPDC088356]|uniref:hypothetical protein n=1 Tax=Sphaerisporangium sp. NPDC088356 TaxID=3154871 RepID=UPI00342BA1D0